MSRKIEDIGEYIPKPSWISKQFNKKVDSSTGEYDGKIPPINLKKLEEMGVSKETAFAVCYIRALAMLKPKRVLNRNEFNETPEAKEHSHDLIVFLLDSAKEKSVQLLDDIQKFYIKESVYDKERLAISLIDKVNYRDIDLLSSARVYPEKFSEGASLIKFKVERRLQSKVVKDKNDVYTSLLVEIENESKRRSAPKEKVVKKDYPPLYTLKNKEDNTIDLRCKVAPHKFLTIDSFLNRKDLESYLYSKDESGDYIHLSDVLESIRKAKELSPLRDVEVLPRTGEEYRNGKNISPEDFHDIFPFKGIQFGKYVENDRRKENLNESFDALNDMCLALNINRKTLLSPMGERTFSLAFGARGRGGKNSMGGSTLAHFENSYFIINLAKRTKSNSGGAKSLGHELGHGIDAELGGGHFLSEQKGETSTLKSKIESPTHKEAIASFEKIMEYIYSSDMFQYAKDEDKKIPKDYFSKPCELFARSFEAFLQYELKHSHKVQNHYLVAYTNESELYPDEKTLEKIALEMKNLFSLMSKHRVELGLDKENEMGFSAPLSEDTPSFKEEKQKDEVPDTPLSKNPQPKRKHKQPSLF